MLQFFILFLASGSIPAQALSHNQSAFDALQNQYSFISDEF